MSHELYFVSECCPIGCGFKVVILKANKTEKLFCFCSGCGCCWYLPKDARIEEANELLALHPTDVAKSGASIPSNDHIVAVAGFADYILGTIPPHRTHTYLPLFDEILVAS